MPISRELENADAWWRPLFQNAAYARLWRLVAGVFLLVGCVALIAAVWTATVDARARRNWPTAPGDIVLVSQQDDSVLAHRYSSIRGRTRYWIEYTIRFDLPADRCRTGMLSEDSSHRMFCEGIVKTRTTISTAQAFDWLLHAYQLNQPVTVLWDPDGKTASDIKIAGEPLRLRYNPVDVALLIGWVVGFGALWAFADGRVTDFSAPSEN